LTTAGTQAGAAGANAAQGAGSTLEQNLATGSQAMTNPFNWFNAGANNMNTYVNAVNGYNDAQAKMAEASASEMSGMGSAAGGVLGLLKFAAKGGPINKYGLGGDVTQGVPEYGAPDFVGGDERDYLNKANPPAPPPALAYPGDAKNIETHVHPLRSLPHRSFNMADGGNVAMAGGGVSPQGVGAMPGMPSWGGSPAPMPGWGGGAPGGWGGETGVPPGGTPGGAVPVHASPSFGVATDDVPAMLTAHEFVIPKDVATWKGHEFYAKHIDQARKAAQAFANRDDIGGEAAPGIPQAPTFVSRPDHAGGAMGGWEAALGGGQGGDWQTALQGFENKLPQQAQTAIQGFENNFPGGWPPQGAWPTG
jgi:hypothetical protein